MAAARSLAEPVVLVIDDAHELAGGGALAGLDLLIEHAPAGLRLVLSGRSCPAWPCPGCGWRARWPMSAPPTWPARRRRPTPTSRCWAWPWPRPSAPELLARTQGWMAGLRLALMAGPGDAPPGTAAPAVIDYLRDEVLERQSPQTRAFLLKTSVAASLPGGLADALAGGSGSGARTLERLARENILVEPPARGSTATTRCCARC